MLLAITFAILAIVGIILILMTNRSLTERLCISGVIFIFALLAYYQAGVSSVSPFGSESAIYFGYYDRIGDFIVGLIGSILGIIGSHIFKNNFKINIKSIAKPLIVVPVVLIPTLKLIQESNDQSLVALIFLFCLSYQNGFFWEKVFEKDA